MNGRLYDPLVARFLNVDPYVQLPDFSQNYNRYTYCLNNPLKFTDPSGYRLAGPEYDSSIDAVNAYLGYMTDVTGAWHLPSGGGGGSSGGTSGYYFSCGNYYDRKSGVVVKWNEVYDNYVVPYSSTDPQDIINILNNLNSTGGFGPQSPEEETNQISQSNDFCGSDKWIKFPNRLQAEIFLKANINCDKEKFFYINSDKSVIVGPWNDAYKTELSPRYLQIFNNGRVVYNHRSYKVDYFVHTQPNNPDPSRRDGKVYDYFNYWGIITLIYFKGNYYFHTHINCGTFLFE